MSGNAQIQGLSIRGEGSYTPPDDADTKLQAAYVALCGVHDDVANLALQKLITFDLAVFSAPMEAMRQAIDARRAPKPE